MARELKTGWLKIATSGSVVYGKSDGRVIQKDWLLQMAENYNTNVHTAQLWFEHTRFYGSAGKVLALKIEDAVEDQLAGEIHLFAILAPNDALIQNNKQGYYTFCSIEVGEDYLGKGSYFLQGVGVTDEPASAGVSELKFSKQDTPPSYTAQSIEFNASQIEDERNFLNRLLPNKKHPTSFNETSESEPAMNEKQFQAFNQSIENQTAAITALAESFKAKPASEGETPAAAAEPSSEFTALQETITAQSAALEKLTAQFSKLLEEQPGTELEETAGGDAAGRTFKKTL
ncbi:GPO family capsid scaffolding protein [Dasania marina]|uniref:GPO family capsid scaffolding protein n=1 Tax=Dasania marina TaxID=471499 RepID=UPI000380A613|nr:GPO family capsid scaffolding protein [Dasania marina]